MTLPPGMRRSLSGLLRRERQRIAVRVVRLVLFALAGIAAFQVRFDFAVPAAHIGHLTSALFIWLIVKPIVFELFGLSESIWRFVSVGDALRLVYGNVVASVLGAVALITFAEPGFPRSIYFIDFRVLAAPHSGRADRDQAFCGGIQTSQGGQC